MANKDTKNLLEQVLSEFFSRLEGDTTFPKSGVKILKSLNAAGKLKDTAAVQAALQKSVSEEHATS